MFRWSTPVRRNSPSSRGSGRQSRIALKAEGKLDNVTMTAYYEMDWLSSGTTSNNNQSNSYTVRQRQIWHEPPSQPDRNRERRPDVVSGGGDLEGPG